MRFCQQANFSNRPRNISHEVRVDVRVKIDLQALNVKWNPYAIGYDINIVSFVALESLEFHNGIPRNSEVLKKKLSSFITIKTDALGLKLMISHKTAHKFYFRFYASELIVVK